MSTLKMAEDGSCECRRCKAARDEKQSRDEMTETEKDMEAMGYLFAVPVALAVVFFVVSMLLGAIR